MATNIQRASTLGSTANARGQLAVFQQEPASAVRYVLFGGLIAILLFAPLAFGAVHEWAFAVLETGAALLFMIWAISQATSRKVEVVSNPLYPPIAIFAFLVLVQIAFHLTAYSYATWTEALKYAAYGVLFFLTLQSFRSERQVKQFGWIVTVYGFLVALFAIVQQFSSHDRIYWFKTFRRGWIYGPYVNHNHYAGLMELLLPIPLALSFNDRMPGGKRVMCAFIAMIMASSIFLSGSRGGMMAFLVETIFLAACLLAQRKGRRSALLLAAALVVTFGLIAWLGGNEIVARIGMIQEHLHNEETTGRLKILRDGLGMFRQRPILGWGLGTFPTVYPQFRSFFTNLFVNEAHNDYLQVLVEMGAIGFGAVLWFLIALYRRGLHRVARESHTGLALRLAALAACTGLLAHSFIDFNLHIPANAAWFFVMCAIATRPAQEAIKYSDSAS